MTLPLLFLGLLGCAGPIEPAALLEPRQRLIRLSVDLRGVHPSEDELLAIEAAPGLFEVFVDRYLDDPRAAVRIREIFNLRYQTRTGAEYFDAAEAGLGSVDAGRVADALADEPLRLISSAFEQDLSFREVVLADYTMANEIVAAAWDLDYPEGASGWQRATYRDARPHAGVLTMNTTWMRFPSMGGNANRHRANAVSRLLLCDDFLSRPIVLDRAAVDQLTDDPENAIASNESCQSCHTTLDPLAAHFFGFFHDEEPEDLATARTYRPENEASWRDWAGTPPAYFGVPTRGLPELGALIAEDSRFASCAVETVYGAIVQRPLTDDDWSALQTHRAAFEADDLRLRALLRSIVTAPEYCDAETLFTASAAQLAGVIEGVTGYRWTFGGRDGLTRADMGLSVLAGGVDGEYASEPSYIPGLGVAFVQERLAQAAAWDVAQYDLDPERSGDARLLRFVTVEQTPETHADVFEAQIRALYLDVTGAPLAEDAGEPALLSDLWKQLYAVEGSPVDAWAGVITAVLRDPTVLFY